MKHRNKVKKWFGEISIDNRTEQNSYRLEKTQERFNRWQNKQNDLLTFLINLFLILSTTSLGYIIDKWTMFDKNILWTNLSLARTTSIILLISILFGILVLFFRLYDYRKTKNVLKYRLLYYKVEQKLKYEAYSEYTKKDLNQLIRKNQQCSELLGDLTWIFFWFQAITFFISISITTIML